MTISARRPSPTTNHETRGGAASLSSASARDPRGADLYGTTPGGSRLMYSREQLLQLASSPLSASPPKGLGPNGIPAEISRSPEKAYYTYGPSYGSQAGQVDRPSIIETNGTGTIDSGSGGVGSIFGRTPENFDVSSSKRAHQNHSHSAQVASTTSRGSTALGSSFPTAAAGAGQDHANKGGAIRGFAPSSPSAIRTRSPSTSFNIDTTSPSSNAAAGSPITARSGAPRSPGSAFTFSGPVSPTQNTSSASSSSKAGGARTGHGRPRDNSSVSPSREKGTVIDSAATTAAAARATNTHNDEHFHMDL
ncbi:hypothetical protein IE81DRAFT_325095 [Ceraceosorus guamensis]|uniref:Uncharacterized protein n=1 Tax=Ceraceosorus guamensis TaxID=1522189 RepID=A0A316VUJ5_9BASI|nr:hypothetical protein IE81DRAFT_325095 [Ceraceosorus guamensis]PWN40914.1 hypothetical protein IE81DRAFT_325095 [Ceraceosorus guamensis]